MSEFKPKKSTYPSDRLDRDSILALETIFRHQKDVCLRLETAGNLPNIDRWIELLDNEDTISAKIVVQVKHVMPRRDFYSIPQYICGYAERIKGEVVVFIACDSENDSFYWRIIDDGFIQLFHEHSEGIHKTWRYHFNKDEYCDATNVRSTIDKWKILFTDRMSSIKNYRQQAEKNIVSHLQK